MNDVIEAVRAKPRGVQARDAASLILLRGTGRDLEVLAGRRPMHVRFMPGVYVFPGGAVDAEDRRPWQTEIDIDSLPPRLLRCARAALRETPAEGDSQRPSRTTFAAGASQADHDSGGK